MERFLTTLAVGASKEAYLLMKSFVGSCRVNYE
jgi:hypothetical protein